MVSGGEEIIWKTGEFWWFNNKVVHEAYNKSKYFRVHIIFDVGVPGL
jgi:aspartyl/asparaginyl beta-hydroxylase (cupin superfamily)